MGSCSSTELNDNEKSGLLSPNDITLIRDSWREIVHEGLCYYGTEFMVGLFLKYPYIRNLWPFFENIETESKMRECNGLVTHGEKVFTAIETVIYTLDDMDTCTKILMGLGYIHYKKGVREEHFSPIGEALIETLQNGLGNSFDAKIKNSWLKFFSFIETQMKIGFDNYLRDSNRI